MSTTAPLAPRANSSPGTGTPIDDAPAINGNHLVNNEPRPPPAPPSAAAPNKKDRKAKKAVDSNEASKLVAQRISQLEHDAAGEKDQEAEIEREVKKANRELQSQTARMSEIQKIDHLTKRCQDLLRDMKQHERESIKNKKRADQLQKEKDHARNELTKHTGLREKLEKLCRELQKENNKLKNENKTLTDTQRRNETAWDEKYSALLQTLDDYQEEKDNPRKQVVDMDLEELCVRPRSCSLDAPLTIRRFKSRFKSLIDQYELRELHFHSLMRTKELELQFNMSKYDKEKKNSEVESARAKQLNTQVQTFSKTEAELRNQLNVYVDKFKQMADERNKHLKDIEDQKKNNEKLKSIITQMQQQGRGIPQGMQGTVESCYTEGEGEVDGEESEYEDDEEYEEGDDVSEEGEEYEEDDEETEDEAPQCQPAEPQQPQPYGPERPPPPVTTNGNH
ncbi:hypothetical protein VMCG_03006 [Cytospora schulzeri]|uniref:Alpha-taxilin n=1 Tax=Cytospora schulzeri TaxID=448051 RepID=A0A423WZL9_9PEZI|nr:hypothetical protein VMCG_03006 [Valsa malicola]